MGRVRPFDPRREKLRDKRRRPGWHMGEASDVRLVWRRQRRRANAAYARAAIGDPEMDPPTDPPGTQGWLTW